MGMDGGVYLISRSCMEWSRLTRAHAALMEAASYRDSHGSVRSAEQREEASDWLALNTLPDTLEGLCNTLRTLGATSCDTPLMFGDVLVLAAGDNIPEWTSEVNEVVNHALGGAYIETWT